jgi:nuclear pore complex protein Nup62
VVGVAAVAPIQVAGSLPLLKNKTMQEILNKWNQDLDNYTKEFHKTAVQVSNQDRQLLDNGFNVNIIQFN